MSSAPGNAYERSPSGQSILPGSSGYSGQPLQLAMRGLDRAIGVSVRAPELLLIVLLITAAMAIGPAIGGASNHEITGCTTISESGEHVLGQDLTSSSNPCILIDANDVVVDGDGHTIHAAGENAIGRSNTDQQNLTVRNVRIENANVGLDFDYVQGVTVEDTTIRYGSGRAISVHQASDVSLRNVTLQGNDVAIKADHSDTDVTGTNVTLGDPSGHGTVMDFYGEGFYLDEVTTPPEGLADNVSLDGYFHLSNGFDPNTFDATVYYAASDVDGYDESTVTLYGYRNSEWYDLGSTVDTEERTVSVSGITSNGYGGAFVAEGPYYDVTVDSPDDAIREGENVSVTATVDNTGQESGNQTVSLTTDGVERDSETLNLAVEESKTVQFEWNTTDGDASIYEAAVESEQDRETWRLRVADPDGPVWETDADWNHGTHERTVSDDVGDRANDTVRLGYTADDSGLVSYWPFDEDSGTNAVDAAGDNDGTVGSGITLDQPGLLNASRYQFENTDRIEVEDDPSLRLQDDMAISFWVRTDTLGDDGEQTFFVDKGGYGAHGYEILDNEGHSDEILFRVYGDSVSEVAIPRSAVNGEGWKHLVGVREGEEIRLYLDGEFQGRDTGSNLHTNEIPLGIGGSSEGEGVLDGSMDEVRIYDRALSESEVQALYDTTRNGTHTTGWRPLTEPITSSNLQLNASATIPVGSATVYVESDTNGDGSVDEVSHPIELSDGTIQEQVTNLSTDTDVVRLRTEFETPDPQQTPVVDRAALEEEADFRVTSVTANGSVVEGETLGVNATVENVGGRQGTQTVTLSVNGTDAQLDASEVTLDGGQSTTVNLTWDTQPGDGGDYEATVASEDDQGTTTVRVDAPAYFDLTLDDVTTQVVENETVVVNATVQNTGDLSGSDAATLTIVKQTSDATVYEVSTETFELAGGETEAVGFTWNTTGYNGEFDATVDTTDDAETRAVSVLAENEFFVRIDEVDESVVAGDPLRVNATVENRGEETAEQQIELSADHGDMLDSQRVNLTGGESAPVNLTWQTGRSDVGDHEMVVSSEDGFNSTEVTVLEPTNVTVDAIESNTPVLTGSTLDVTATVTNVGDVNGTQELNLTIDGVQQDARSVTVNASETKDVTLGWTTATGDAGDYTAAFHTENDSATTGVRVDAPANLTVDVVDYDETVVEGEDLAVTANVTNVGDRTASQVLTLTVVDDGAGEVEVATESVTIELDESRNVTLAWTTTSGDAGDYTAAFESENDSDSRNVRVDAPANLTVDVVEHDASVVEGEQFAVTANVTNVGDVNATQNATMTLDSAVDGAAGEPFANQVVSLPGGESTNVTLAWSTSEGDAGSYSATVATENDSAAVDVDVLTPPELSVSITDANASVYEADTLSVNATVENLGQATANQTIGLNVSSAETAEELVASTHVEVGGGNATDVTLDWAVDADATGADATLNYTATVASEDDADGTDVQVRDDQAYFVSIDDVGSPVTEGESVSVAATIGVHDGTGTSKNVSLYVGGVERDRTNVSLTGENETTVTLTWATGDDDAGAYAATVASEDHTDSASVTVEEPSSGGLIGPPSSEPTGTLSVAIEGTDEPVQIGETLTVSALVSNGVDQELTETIALSARGAERDSRTVTLAPNESRTIELQWATTVDDAGSHPVTVAGSGTSDVRYVDVVDEPAFDVEIEDTNAPIDAGRPLRVTASVTANANDTQTIALERPGGGTVDSQSVSLTAGESTTLTLTWRTAHGDAGSGEVTVRGTDDADSASVRVRRVGEVGVTLDRFDSTVVVNQSGAVDVTVENGERGEQTIDVVLEVDGTERDVRTITLAAGARESVTLHWTATADDLGDRELTVRAGQGSVTRSVAVEEEEASGGVLARAPRWAGAAVDYEPTEQDTHVGGFLWLTALIAGVGAVLLATRPSLEGRLLAATLFVAAFRTSTDVVHATFEEVATEHLLALNTSLELYVGLLFLAFAAAYADTSRLLRRRTSLALVGIGLAGTAAAATNARHGLVFGEVSLVGGPFTYVTAEMGPLGWVILAITLASLLASVALLVRSFLAGTDPTWRPVGVLAAGLFMAVVVVLLSAFERGPLPQYDYTGAGVGGFLIVATTTAVGHGLHRIKHDAQKSLIQDLDDPIVVATDARVVVDFNAAAADVLPGIDEGAPFDDVVSSALEWPEPGETTTGEFSLSELLAPSWTGADRDGDGNAALTDGAGRGAPVEDGGLSVADEQDPTPAGGQDPVVTGEQDASTTDDHDSPAPVDPGSTDEAPEDDAHYLVQTTSVTADTGDSIGYTVRFTDVTELTRRTEELTRRNAQLEQVASTISHDLRNPMTVADGYVEMLRDTVPASDADVEPATLTEHLEPVRESLARMDEIIADILALARSKDPASEERLAFGEAAEEAWATVDTGQATLFVESAGTVTADPGHLRRILENLFRNAVEHVGPDVAVLVGLTEDGFYVADDGPGIPEDRRDEVFEEGHTSNPDGTGLGLSIVSQLAHAQDWDVHLDEEYDGAKFVLTGCETVTDGTGPASWSRD